MTDCKMHTLSRKRSWTGHPNIFQWSLPDSWVSTTTQLSHDTFSPMHKTQFPIEMGILSLSRHILVALDTFHKPTCQLNFSPTCFETLQYWGGGGGAGNYVCFNVLRLPVQELDSCNQKKIEGCRKKTHFGSEQRSLTLAISASFQQEKKKAQVWSDSSLYIFSQLLATHHLAISWVRGCIRTIVFDLPQWSFLQICLIFFNLFIVLASVTGCDN